MASKDYIKLYRSLLEWEWFTDRNVLCLWVYILLKANWKDVALRGSVVKRGSFVTTYDRMSIETGLTTSQLRTALSKLEKTGEVSREIAGKSQVITVEKYGIMQLVEKKEPTNDDREIATEEEIKKERNNNTNTNTYKCRPTLEEVRAYIKEMGYHFSAEDFIAYYDSKGWVIGKNSPMKSWQAACRTWESNYKKKSPNAGVVWTEIARDIEEKLK